MLRFCGFDLELTVEGPVGRPDDEPAAYRATDADGDDWLIVEAPGAGRDLSWWCAPASRRAVELVAAGQAAPTDAVLHSRTGWVEIVRVVGGHAVPDERVACWELASGRAAMTGWTSR